MIHAGISFSQMNKYIFLLLLMFLGCSKDKPKETKEYNEYGFPKKIWQEDDWFGHIDIEVDDEGNTFPVWRKDE